MLKSLCRIVKMLAQLTANVKSFLKMRETGQSPLKKKASLGGYAKKGKRIILCLASAWVLRTRDRDSLPRYNPPSAPCEAEHIGNISTSNPQTDQDSLEGREREISCFLIKGRIRKRCRWGRCKPSRQASGPYSASLFYPALGKVDKP